MLGEKKEEKMTEKKNGLDYIGASKEKIWMTVPEMGNLLGLKKTGRYWLVHKNFFECRDVGD